MSDPRFILSVEPLTEEVKLVAFEELRETPENKEKALKSLRELLHNTTDLHFDDSDYYLLVFLRPCHFYPESALKLMRSVAEFKKNNTEIIANLMPQDERSSFVDNNVVNVLVNRDQHGRRVLIVNCGELWDTKRVSSDQLFRLFYLIHVAAQVELETQVRGVVVIMDFDGLGMKQVRALSPTFSRRLLTFIQYAMPLRMKAVHIINQPFLFKMVWSLFKPFIEQKLNSRMFFHARDMASLHKYIDPKYLPSNYGGTLPAIDYSGREWFESVQNHETHIAKWNSFGFSSQSSKK